MKHIPIYCIAFLLLIKWGPSLAQPVFPDPGELYRDDIVPRVDILIHPDSLEWIYENVESDHEFPATFIFDNGTIHDTVQEIGFRLRGNTSRYSKKKSFKVSFNTFHPGRKYHGVEKMNLNGEHNDPSIIRSKLCWDILRKMDIPAPYANHVQVYINGNYYGLFINVEHIDEEFVKSRFGNNDGNLFKCLWPADLTYLGENPDNYKFTAGDRRAYDLKINEEEDDYTDLRDLIRMLHVAPDAEFKCQIDQLFNVYDYLKIMAFDILTADWDGYIYNKNNFYLYHNLETGKFEYIPYDLDNTFGIDWFNIDWGIRNIYQWGPGDSRPLFDRLMGYQEFRDLFSFYLKEILENICNPELLEPGIDQKKQQILPYVVNDPYYPQDYGYTVADFLNSYNQSLGGHVKYGLKPYIQTRYQTALQQVAVTDVFPVIKYISHPEPGLNEPVTIRAFVQDDTGLSEVVAIFSVNEGDDQELTLFDDGMHGDGVAGDHFFGNSLPGFPEPTVFRFQITATSLSGQNSVLPCIPVSINIGVPPSSIMLYINEFMASNASTISDEWGDPDDWIEIYNGSDQSVWLGDKYLSDNLDNPVKWQFPNTTLMPGAYLIIWADDEPGQGPFHAPYKLDKDGEEIGIFDAASTGYALIDSVTFGLQETDVSFGRVTDGSPEWKFFDLPTPGYTNSASGAGSLIAADKLVIYPNPCTGGLVYFNLTVDILLYDMYGRLIVERNSVNSLSLEGLQAGMYLVKTKEGIVRKLMVD